MSDERELWDDQQPDDFADADDSTDVGEASADDAFPLLSADAFDEELEALAAYAVETDGPEDTFADDQPAPDEFVDEDDSESLTVNVIEADESEDGFVSGDYGEDTSDDYDTPAVDDDDRLRQPRAGRFRRTLSNQLGMLPLSLLLIGLGAFLLARAQDVSGLPDLDDRALVNISVVTVGFAAVFHALLSGRRERGVLFAGLWVLSTAGLIAALVYGIDDTPDAAEWWPLGLWSTALALLLTYLIERVHDRRLVLLAIMAVVAGCAAYLVSGDVIDNATLQRIADYWPLLLTVVGVGLLPLVFQRRTD